MKILLNVTLDELEDKVNRQIEVDENISLIDLCEFIITSMNGSKIPIYEFEYGEVTYYPFDVMESEEEKTLVDLTLKDLKIKKRTEFCIEYDYDNFYFFNVVVDDMYENDDVISNKFKVLSGRGYGVLEDESSYNLKWLLNAKDESYFRKSEREYLEKKFECEECNKRINDYIEYRKAKFSSKKYIFNVSLDGFDKEIKRKIIVNNNIDIDSFCRKVVVAMNGDLSHLYGIKIGKQCLSEYYNDIELFYLNLKEKQKLKIIYDWGDNWIFNLTLSKIIDGYGDVDFEVISGKGYGIIDDCGGIWGLSNIFSGEDTSWGEYDINDFDLEECNKNLQKIS